MRLNDASFCCLINNFLFILKKWSVTKMTEDKQVQMKREEYVGADVVLEDIIPKTATDAVQDPTNGNNLAETLNAIWAAINNKLSRNVNSVNGRTGVVIITAADVGLENVDNVSTDDLKSWVINLVAEQFHNKHLILADTKADIDRIRDTHDTKYDGVSFVASHLTDDPDDHTMVIGYFFTDDNNSLTYDYRTFDLDDEYGVGKFYYADDHVTVLGEYFNDYENNIAAGTFSHVEGSRNETHGAYSHLEGCQNYNTGASVHMGGTGNNNSGSNVYMSGELNTNASDFTFLHGKNNKVNGYGDASFVVGDGNDLRIPESFLFGKNNKAEDQSMQIGLNGEIIKSNKLNFMVGEDNYAEGDMSTIIGIGNNIIDKDFCTIIGGYNTSNAPISTIIGDANTLGSGSDAVVFGSGNYIAYGANSSMVFGFQSTASLSDNYTFGFRTNTAGQRAINFGYGQEMDWELEYSLLTEAPSNWSTNYFDYFTKVGMEYVKIPEGEEAPSFALDTYYRGDNVKISTRKTGVRLDKANPFSGSTRFEEIIPLHDTLDRESWSIAYGSGSVLFGRGNIAGGVDDFVEGSRNITYGNQQSVTYELRDTNSNHVEGSHNELRWRVDTYKSLDAMPATWANKFKTYYEKNSNDEYVHLSGTVAPTWEAGKYYDSSTFYTCTFSHVEGSNNIITDVGMCHVEGQNNIVSSIKNSHIEGNENAPYVDPSLILPSAAASSITGVHIEGYKNLVNEHGLDATVNSNSHIEGALNIFAGTGSHVQNFRNSADDYGTAMGLYNRATPFTTVVGFSNKPTEVTEQPVGVAFYIGDGYALNDNKYCASKFMVVTNNSEQSFEFISPFVREHGTAAFVYESTTTHERTVISGLDCAQLLIEVGPNRWRIQRSKLEALPDAGIDSSTDLTTVTLLLEIVYNENVGSNIFEVGNGAFADANVRDDLYGANAFAVGTNGNAYVQSDVRLHYDNIITTEVVPVSIQKLIKKLIDDGVISIDDIRTDEFK
jgi:hypothetical protein